MTVYLLEDDVELAHQLKRILEHNYYEVKVFELVSDFLKESIVAPSVLLCDLNMPDMSGLELQKKCRRSM